MVVYTDSIRKVLKKIFLENLGVNPFKQDGTYNMNIDSRYGLDDIDIAELVIGIENYFNIRIAYSEKEELKIRLMNIDELVDYVTSKLQK